MREIAIKINEEKCWVYGVEVPSEYLEGHLGMFETFLKIVKGRIEETFGSPEHRPENILIQPGEDGMPGPNGEPGGKGGDVTFSIKDDIFMTVTHDHIEVEGQVRDRTDPVAHAIQVYSDLREFIRIHEAMISKED